MPNRVLRDWTNSERFDELSEGAEVFFTRLIMKADDFGGFYGNTKLLKSHLYPLKDFKHDKILKWIQECAAIGIIIYYQVDGKQYIRINDFGQRTRIMKSKFPEPPTNDRQMTVNCLTDDGLKPKPKPKPNQTETETEVFESVLDFEPFWNLYDKKVGKDKCEKKWLSITEEDREKIKFHIPKYKISQPDKKFRKDPQTYLNNKSWNDEIILENGFGQNSGRGSAQSTKIGQQDYD